MASPKKHGVDIVLAMGGPKKPSSADEYDDMPDMDDDKEGLPPEFELAWQEYHSHPSAETFWAAVEACTDHKVSSDERMKNFLEKQGSNSRQD